MSYAKQCELLSFWVYAPTQQEQRRQLEAHLSLLLQTTDRPLDDLISQSVDRRNEHSHLHTLRYLLHDIRRRGATITAIREAYINEYGGFILDLPAWLADVEFYIERIYPLTRQTVRDKTSVKLLLREALQRGYHDDRVVPEMLAELHYRLGYWFFVDLSPRLPQQVKTVIEHYEAALQVYTNEQYPKQHAKIDSALKNAYQRVQEPGFLV